MLLLVGNNYVDVVDRAEAVVHGAQQAVGIRRQVDADDIRRFVGDHVEKTWILVCKAVVILTPYGAGEEDVERSDLGPPLDFGALFQPLAVLAHHRVDDVDERLVAVKHAMAAAQEVALEPSLDIVLR